MTSFPILDSTKIVFSSRFCVLENNASLCPFIGHLSILSPLRFQVSISLYSSFLALFSTFYSNELISQPQPSPIYKNLTSNDRITELKQFLERCCSSFSFSIPEFEFVLSNSESSSEVYIFLFLKFYSAAFIEESPNFYSVAFFLYF